MTGPAGGGARAAAAPLPVLRIVGAAHQHDHAVVMGFTVGFARHQIQQLFIVARILLLTPAAGRLAGKARRIHAGRAVQRINANPGIVCQRGQTRVPARMPRLGQRVLDKSTVRFGRLAHAERRLRNDLDVERRQYRGYLVQLADVVGGDDDFFH